MQQYSTRCSTSADSPRCRVR